MGAWANDPFGNDTAMDWVYGLEDADDLSLIEATLQTVLDAGDEYLEAPAGDEAIAAADVIARLRGRFYNRNSYTESVDSWVAAHPIKPSPRVNFEGAAGTRPHSRRALRASRAMGR